MNEYQWINKEQTRVKKHPNIYLSGTGSSWKEFQDYLAGGGQVDPFLTRDEWVTDTLGRLQAEHNRIVSAQGIERDQTKKDTKLIGALRREQKGQANAKDLQLLNDNDEIDSWLDGMESQAETVIVWIEDPDRTEQELLAFDLSTIDWPENQL